jgi:putative oxidoreductase
MFTRALQLVLHEDASSRALNGALVAVRTALAWIFVYYGAGKLFGSFHGPGLHRTALFFSQSAHLRPGGLFAVLGGVIEFAGAVAVAFGLASRLAAFALLGDQVMAMVTVTWRNGINSLSNHPGYEFNLCLAVLALVIVLLGAGRFSLDHLLRRRLTTSVTLAETELPESSSSAL